MRLLNTLENTVVNQQKEEQRKILQYLRLCGIFCCCVNCIVLWHNQI